MSAVAERSGLAADDLVRELIRDVVPQVRMDELMASCVEPIGILLDAWAEAGGDGDRLSSGAVWDRVRERHPRAACFPLGTAAERAVRRVALDLSRRHRGWTTDGGAPKVPAGEVARLVHCFVAFLVFETALLDLRGSSEDLGRDYAFWYHWRPDGEFRTPTQEAELRRRLWAAARRKATGLVSAWVQERRIASREDADEAGGRWLGCPVDADLDAALGKVFASTPMRRLRRLPQAPVTVLGSKGDDRVERQLGPIDSRALEIELRDTGRNVWVGTDDLLTACADPLDSRVQDLIDLATVFYLGDFHLKRRNLFGRELVVGVPVRHPQLWSEHEPLLARIGSFLTGSQVRFRFAELDGDPGPSRALSAAQGDRCVCLFSGGLDSFTGAAEAVEEKREVFLVSHAPTHALKQIQAEVLGHLDSTGGGARSVTVPTHHTIGSAPSQSLYQHGRSFLFLSLGAAVALSNGVGDLRVYENGPVALNPPFSEARFNTRTAHPVFLALFEQLIREAFEVELRVHNPFALLTKGEVVGRLGAHHLPALRRTNSCWTYGMVSNLADKFHVEGFKGGHCGRCIPCIWRRAAVRRADIEERNGEYLWDKVLENESDWPKWLTRTHFTVLLDLYRACRNALATSTDDELLDVCPELDEIGPGTLAERLDLHRRYCEEVVGWFDANATRMYYRLP